MQIERLGTRLKWFVSFFSLPTLKLTKASDCLLKIATYFASAASTISKRSIMHIMNKMYPVITTLYNTVWSISLYEDTLAELLRLSMENVSDRIQLFLLMELFESFQKKKMRLDGGLPSARVTYTIANFIKHRQPHPMAQLYGKSLINHFNAFTPFPQSDQLFHVARLKGYGYPRVDEFVFEGAIVFAWDKGTGILYWMEGGGPRANLTKQLAKDVQNATLYMKVDTLSIEMNIGGEIL